MYKCVLHIEIFIDIQVKYVWLLLISLFILLCSIRVAFEFNVEFSDRVNTKFTIERSGILKLMQEKNKNKKKFIYNNVRTFPIAHLV